MSLIRAGLLDLILVTNVYISNKPDWAIVREFPQGYPCFYYLNTLPQTMNLVLEELLWSIAWNKKTGKFKLVLEFFIGAGLTHSWYKGFKGLVRTDLNNETEYRGLINLMSGFFIKED